MNKFISMFMGINLLLLTACSSNTPVANNQAGTMSKEEVVSIQKGTVASVKKVSIMGRRGNAVGTVGSITGSIIGSSVPVAGSIIGSLIGGAVGSEADTHLSKQDGLEITLQLDNGERVVVTQLAKTAFKAGDRVQLTLRDNVAQVTHL